MIPSVFLGFLSVILSVFLFGANCWGVVEHTGPNDTHYAIPDGWQSVTGNQRSAVIVHTDLPVTLSITAHIFPKGITINRLQEMHMVGQYDGWISIGTELGTLFDNQRANATDSFKSIYGKTNLSQSLEPVRDFVINYYFVKDTTGYIVSIHTPQQYWKKLKPDIQFFLKHFWIGPDPKQMIRDKNPYLWPTRGKTSTHSRHFPIHTSPSTSSTPNWDVAHPLEGLASEPIVGGSWYAFSQNNQLVVGDVKTGAKTWAMSIPGGIASQLAANKNLLFFVTGSSPNILVGIDPKSQQIVVRTPLNERLASEDLVIYNNQLLVQLLTELVAIDTQTGGIQWRHPNKSTFPPTVASGSLILIPENRAVHHVDIDSQSRLNQWPIEPAISPVLRNETVWATHYKKNSIYVTILDTKTGAMPTQLTQTVSQIQSVWPAALSQHHYGVLFNDDTGMHYLWIIDTRSRETSGFILIDTPVRGHQLIGTPDTFEFVCRRDANTHIRSVHVQTNTQTQQTVPAQLKSSVHHMLYSRFGFSFILGDDGDNLRVLSLP